MNDDKHQAGPTTLGYARAEGRRAWPIAWRIGVEILLAIGLFVSLSHVYSTWLEFSTRRAMPSTRAPLYCLPAAAACFATGLALCLCGDTRRRPERYVVWTLLMVGLGLLVIGFGPVVWE